MKSSAFVKNNEKLSQTIGYYAALFAFGLTAAALGPALPSLAAHTNSDLSQISVLFSARALGFFFGAFLLGRIYDNYRGHPVMAAALIITAVATALLPVTPLLWLLAVVNFILGASTGQVNVGSNTLLVWVHQDEVGPWMNGMAFVLGIGAFLSPIIITLAIAESGDVIWAFWILSLFILPPAVWLMRVRSPEIPRHSEDGHGDRINYKLVFPISMIFLLYIGTEASFSGWIYTYSFTLHPAAIKAAGYLTATFWGAFTFGRLAAIPLATRLRPRLILFTSFLGSLVSIVLILIGSRSMVAVVVGTVGFGLSMASIFPTMFSFANHRMKITGKVNGWFLAATAVGGMTMPWLMGQFFETKGPQFAMMIVLVALLFALGILIVLLYRGEEHPQPYLSVE